jgi:hypothetical protein
MRGQVETKAEGDENKKAKKRRENRGSDGRKVPAEEKDRGSRPAT